jgi:hypothetical protein
VTPAATDDHGRPIVAELGRAETPEETADRKAAASAKRRSNQTAVNLVIALVASLGIVLLLVLVVVRPGVSQLPHVDYASVAADAQGAVDVELVVPVLPPGWWANRAELNTRAADDVATWEIGFITPSDQYIAFTQGIDTNPTWVAGKVASAPSSGSTTIEGVTWEFYDRRDADDPGNLAYALVTTSEGSTFVLSGTASEQEFATLAASVTAELES